MNDINLCSVDKSLYFKKVSSKGNISKDDICDGYLIESSESEARRIVDSLKGTNKKVAIVGGDAVFNRRVIETLKVDFLVSVECGLKKDSLKQRDSGFNHVFAKLAVKKGISLVVDMSAITSLSGVDQARVLSRIMQNIVVCRKAGCSLKVASFASSKKGVLSVHARRSFGISLGMSSSQARDAVIF